MEIKAVARDWPAQLDAMARMAPEAGALLQEDTFFPCAHGRLKLRIIREGDGRRAQLIAYERADAVGPRTSTYHIAPVEDPDALRAALAAALGAGPTVRKRRLLFLVGQTRVHFDEVEGLGRFVELEVVLRAEQSEADGGAIAAEWMRRLDIRADDLIEGAYADLLPER